MEKYNKTFKFAKSEEEAQSFCNEINRKSNYYIRKKYPSTYTNWESLDHKEKYFICWYVNQQ